jgi:hypothetical protein
MERCEGVHRMSALTRYKEKALEMPWHRQPMSLAAYQRAIIGARAAAELFR